MPRLTRAQLKAQAEGTTLIHEDDESTSETREASPLDDCARPVLKDLLDVNIPTTESEQTVGKKVPQEVGTKKGGRKNAKKQAETPVEEVTVDVEVLEDHEQSDDIEAAEIAAESLRNRKGMTEPFPEIVDTARSQTPSTSAVDEVTRSLSKSPTKRQAAAEIPRFEPKHHATPIMADASEHDSFVHSCKKASHFKLPMIQQPQEEGLDSFVEQLIARSPSKPSSRIEDSVEAIDALEDAIDQVAGELPALVAEYPLSPIKNSTLKSAPAQTKLADSSSIARSGSTRSLSSKASFKKLSPPRSSVKAVAKQPLKNLSKSQQSTTATRPAMRVSSKPTIPRSPAAKGTATTKHPATASSQTSISESSMKPQANTAHKRAPGSILSSLKAPFVPKPSSKPPTTSTFTLPGDAVAAKLKAEREERQKRMEAAEIIKQAKPASIVKRAVSIDKKPPTAPSYQLPGDAVSAKLKAQREARLQGEAGTAGEAKAKSKTFKARPAPVPRTSVLPRDNKASSLRMSSVQREESAKRRDSDKENMAPSPQAQAPIPKQRLNVRRIRPSIGGTITHPAASRRSMNLANQNVQESKAEPTLLLGRAEKEAAARRARAEAAERGRLASREWAEKQKKKAEASKVKAKRDSAVAKELEEVLEVARLKGQVA